MAKAAPSLTDLFAKVDKKVAPAAKAAVTPKKDRPILNLPADVQAEFERWIGYRTVFSIIDTQNKNQWLACKEGAFDAYTQYMWDRKSTPPSNPLVEIKEGSKVVHSAIFQVQARFRINVAIGELPEDQAPEDAVVEALRTVGLSEEDAVLLVNNEIDFTPSRGFKNFTKIFQEGTDEEKASLTRLMMYVMAEPGSKGKVSVDAFSDEDRLNLMFNTATASVIDKKKFMDRLPNYVKSLEQLRAVLTVIEPNYVFASSVKFMNGSNVSEQTEALKEVAASMLGISD